jgi:Cupin domain
MTSIARTSSIDTPKLAPIVLSADGGQALWFIGSLTTIKASGQSTAGGVAVIEHLSPRDSGSPLHVHHREDEWFYVMEGELTLWVGGQTDERARRIVRLRTPPLHGLRSAHPRPNARGVRRHPLHQRCGHHRDRPHPGGS